MFINKIMSPLYDIMTFIDNKNIAIILKTIKLKNIIILGQTKFILVLTAELNGAIGSDTFLRGLSVLLTYRPNEQNQSTFTLC